MKAALGRGVLHNPGNIAYGNGKLAKELGAIGRLHATAIFPDYETGRKAIFAVLRKTDFQERTLARAISAWAPSEDHNDPIKYAAEVGLWTGLDMSRLVNSLSNAELPKFVDAI